MQNTNKKKFKSRKLLSPKDFKLKWGSCGIFFYQQGRFEYAYYVFLKKILKKILKKATYNYETRKYWIFIQPNISLSKKSKNSRMGKGKGATIRRAFRSQIFSPLIEFIGVHPKIILKIKEYLVFKTRVNLTWVYNPALKTPNLNKNFISNIIFQKYNYI